MTVGTLSARVAAYLGVAESDLHQIVEQDGEVVVLLNTYAKYRIPLSALPDAAELDAPATAPEQPEQPPAAVATATVTAAPGTKARRKPGR